MCEVEYHFIIVFSSCLFLCWFTAFETYYLLNILFIGAMKSLIIVQTKNTLSLKKFLNKIWMNALTIFF